MINLSHYFGVFARLKGKRLALCIACNLDSVTVLHFFSVNTVPRLPINTRNVK